MKDSEFFELLNLYLDHEITAEDAARLETEVQSNPKRREVYNQYCRMQKACTMLAKDFAEAAPAASTSSENVVAFEQPRRSAWGPGFFAAGGLVAAAACLAVVLVKRGGLAEPTTPAVTGSIAIANPAPLSSANEAKVVITQGNSVATTSSIPRTVTVPVFSRSDLQPVVATRALMLSNKTSEVAVMPVGQSGVTQLDWIGKLELAPMHQAPVEKFTLQTQLAEPKKADVQGPDDSIAFVAFGYGKGN